MAQWLTNPTRTQVQSLASLSGLRILLVCEQLQGRIYVSFFAVFLEPGT